MTFFQTALLLAAISVALRVGVDYAVQPSFTVHTLGGVVVTGASSGVGEHASAALAARTGLTVFSGVRKAADAERLAATYPGIVPLTLDVTKPESISAAVETVRRVLEERGLPLVGLVNNAGVQSDLPVELQDPGADRFTFEVNVFGLLDVTRAFLPLLRAAGDGARIVNVGSLAGVVSAPGSATYAGSKFAVEGISDALRMELQGPFGISVSLLQPGYVRSKMGSKAHESSSSSYGVSKAQYDLYRATFEGFFETDKELSTWEKSADPEDTTTWAVLHALTSATPRARYPVANAGDFPAWFVAGIKSVLPDRVMDLLVLDE